MSESIRRAVADRFDLRSATYDESRMHADLARAVAEFVDLGGVRSVLDVATGTGLVLRSLRQLPGDMPALLGGDVSSGMLQVARRALPGAVLVQCDAAALPFADGSVDLVTCVTALHLLPEPAGALAEWARVLRPAGHLVTATFAEFDPGRHHRELLAGDRSAKLPYPMNHEPFSTPAALSDIARTAGFRLLRHTRWTDGHETLLIAALGRS